MSNNANVAGLEFVESTGTALKTAQQLATQVVAEQEKVATVVPARVDLLLNSGLIQETDKEAATEQLQRHDGAVDMVGSLIQILGEQKQASQKKIAELNQKLGTAGPGESDSHGTKTAGAHTNRSTDDLSAGGVVGQRAGSRELRASDMPLLKAAGMTPGR